MVGCKREQTADNAGQQDASQLGDTNLMAGTQTPLSAPGGTPTPSTSATTPSLPTPGLIPGTTQTPAVAPIQSATEYTVAKGDSFYSIGKKYHVSMKAIQDANPSIAPEKLQPGQKLQIPAATASVASSGSHALGAMSADSADTYTVKTGDNLTKIALAHGTTTKAIRTANHLTTDKIKAGQKLVIPGHGSSPATPATPVDTTTPAAAPAPSTTSTAAPTLSAPSSSTAPATMAR